MCVDMKEFTNTSNKLQEEFIWVHKMFEIGFSFVKLNVICISGSSLTMKHACIIFFLVKMNRNVNIMTTKVFL